jgi:hypothetical protein
MGGVEMTPPNNILLYLPSHALGYFNAARIPFTGGDLFDRNHFQSPLKAAPEGKGRPMCAL